MALGVADHVWTIGELLDAALATPQRRLLHYPELRCGAAIQPLLKVDRLYFLVPGFFAV